MSKYKIWYDALCAKGKARVVKGKKPMGLDAHHITPKSLGGSNRRPNMAWLTPREHFIAHLLLYKIDPECVEMQRALWFMRHCAKYDGARMTAKSYEAIQKHLLVELRDRFLKFNSTPGFRENVSEKIREAVCKPVVRITPEGERVFSSARRAADWCRENGYPKASHTNIGARCKGKGFEAYGACWRYENADFQGAVKRVYTGRKVVNVQTGEIFATIASAIRWLKGNGFPQAQDSNIVQVCKGGRMKSAYGYTWQYA